MTKKITGKKREPRKKRTLTPEDIRRLARARARHRRSRREWEVHRAFVRASLNSPEGYW